jgi:hypothetical protein
MDSIRFASALNAFSSSGSVMTTPLLDARMRLEWAKREISDLERAISLFFGRNPYRYIIDADTKPGRVLRRVVLTESIPNDWSRHVSRIAADLREPLDYATVAIGESFNAEKAHLLCLPIEDSEQAFEREMKKRKIERRCPQLAAFLRAAKPYKGPNDLIFGLHELCRTKKHRRLSVIGMAPMGLQMAFKGTVDGPVSLGAPVWEPAENGFIVLDAPNTSKFDSDIQFTFGVSLPELEGFERQPVTVVFMQMANAVQNILAEFERQFFS